MTNEEIQKKMDFIIEQQAQFAIDIQLLREAQEAEAKLWREKHNSLNEKHNTLTEALTTVIGMIGKLSAAQERTDQRVAELAEAQAHNDERLNAFIAVVERYISERRNGTSQG